MKTTHNNIYTLLYPFATYQKKLFFLNRFLLNMAIIQYNQKYNCVKNIYII